MLKYETDFILPLGSIQHVQPCKNHKQHRIYLIRTRSELLSMLTLQLTDSLLLKSIYAIGCIKTFLIGPCHPISPLNCISSGTLIGHIAHPCLLGLALIIKNVRPSGIYHLMWVFLPGTTSFLKHFKKSQYLPLISSHDSSCWTTRPRISLLWCYVKATRCPHLENRMAIPSLFTVSSRFNIINQFDDRMLSINAVLTFECGSIPPRCRIKIIDRLSKILK